MTVNLDQLKQRINKHVYSEWRVVTEGQLDGPVIKDAFNNEILSIDVGHAVWTCDDEQDGCPKVAQNAVAFAQLLVDFPGHILELIQAVERLQDTVYGLEWELREAGRGF